MTFETHLLKKYNMQLQQGLSCITFDKHWFGDFTKRISSLIRASKEYFYTLFPETFHEYDGHLWDTFASKELQ